MQSCEDADVWEDQRQMKKMTPIFYQIAPLTSVKSLFNNGQSLASFGSFLAFSNANPINLTRNKFEKRSI